MGIYSTNRLSSTKSSAMRPDMSYRGSAAVARCMYESVLNDNVLGESLLMQDFQEARGIREGTIMRSELNSIQEASLEGFFKKAKEMLKKLGEKIMGIFRTVYAKLTQWFVRYGKAYAAMHRKTVMNKNIKNLTIKKYRMPKSDFKLESLSNNVESTLKTYQSQIADKKLLVSSRGLDESEFKEKMLEGLLRTDKTSVSDYQEFIMDKAFEKEDDIEGSKISSSMLSKILDTVAEGRKPIKDLKKTEDKLVKAIKKAQNDLDKIEKSIDKTDEKDRTVADKNNAASIPYIKQYLAAIQTAINTITSASIKVVKFDIKQSRSVIAQIVAYSPTHESNLYMIEAAEDAEDEFDEEMESPAEVEVADGYEDFDDEDDED